MYLFNLPKKTVQKGCIFCNLHMPYKTLLNNSSTNIQGKTHKRGSNFGDPKAPNLKPHAPSTYHNFFFSACSKHHASQQGTRTMHKHRSQSVSQSTSELRQLFSVLAAAAAAAAITAGYCRLSQVNGRANILIVPS